MRLNLSEAKEPVPDFNCGPDRYTVDNVHDYASVSFLRMDPAIKKASKEVIDKFNAYYPELVSRKFFVNVPALMGWVWPLMKLIVPAATFRK